MAATMDPDRVQDLVDHFVTDVPTSTDPQQSKTSSSGKGKRKASAAPIAQEDDVMECTFQLKNSAHMFTFMGTRNEPDGTTMYIYKKKKAKLIRDISVLKAERAYLARPERIAKYAEQLGMRPIRGDQISRPTARPGGTRN